MDTLHQKQTNLNSDGSQAADQNKQNAQGCDVTGSGHAHKNLFKGRDESSVDRQQTSQECVQQGVNEGAFSSNKPADECIVAIVHRRVSRTKYLHFVQF